MIDSQTRADSIRTVTADTFATLVLDAAGPVVVEFMSYGCSHCRVLEPVLEAVSEALSDSMRFFRVNVALDQDLGDRYAVGGTPTLVMFRDARKAGRVEGPQPAYASLLTAVKQPFRA